MFYYELSFDREFCQGAFNKVILYCIVWNSYSHKNLVERTWSKLLNEDQWATAKVWKIRRQKIQMTQNLNELWYEHKIFYHKQPREAKNDRGQQICTDYILFPVVSLLQKVSKKVKMCTWVFSLSWTKPNSNLYRKWEKGYQNFVLASY